MTEQIAKCTIVQNVCLCVRVCAYQQNRVIISFDGETGGANDRFMTEMQQKSDTSHVEMGWQHCQPLNNGG